MRNINRLEQRTIALEKKVKNIEEKIVKKDNTIEELLTKKKI